MAQTRRMRVVRCRLGPRTRPRKLRREERGFTLIELMLAALILVFGLIAVTNLVVVAASSNAVGSASTAAVTEASTTLEALEAIPYDQLVPGGSLSAPVSCTLDCAGNPASCPGACVKPGNFSSRRDVPGVGLMNTRWQIEPVTGDPQMLYIVVEAAPASPLTAGRARAVLTTFRSCTTVSQGCPEP